MILVLSICFVMQSDSFVYAEVKAAEAADPARIESYKDIPGITDEQIAAIEKVLAEHSSFRYGIRLSSECFVQEDGSLGGFAVLFCERLSELFGTKFVPEIRPWPELGDEVLSGEVDFSGDYRPAADVEGIFKTQTIVERSVKTARLTDAAPIENIAATRPVKFGFLYGSISKDLISGTMTGTNYEVVNVKDNVEAEQKLRSGEIDLFVADSSIVSPLMVKDGITVSNYTPLTYKRISVTTSIEEYQPILEAIDLYLDGGGFSELSELYTDGYAAFCRAAFLSSLTEEERDWLDTRIIGGVSVKLAISPSNYPVNFYNAKEEAWDGIAIDVLEEIQAICGLDFEIVNTPDEGWSVVFKMLEDGEADMVAELIHTDERAGRFLFGESFAEDQYVLISRVDTPSISVNQVLYARVGLVPDTAYTEMFHTWFPDNDNTVEYPDMYAAFDGLEAGEIECIMATENRLLAVTNYMEQSGFKVNLVFEHASNSQYGYNLSQGTLKSVIGKAQRLVDTESISNFWMHMTYDYEKTIAKDHARYMLIVSILLGVVILLLVIQLALKRTREVKLEALVGERTSELEAASTAKSDFLANMSHEMRTPLNAVIGLTELTINENEDNTALPVDVRTNLQKIYGSGVALLALVNDLLDLSKIESGKFELVPAAYDIPSMINDTVTFNIMRINGKPIEFKLEVDGGLPGKLFGDELRIKQVFNNLLSNAFKYTKEGTVTWRISCEPAGEGFVRLKSEVADTGIGIREEDLPKLFGEYSQVDTKANRAIEGTGLGLAITKNMVALMGGAVEVKSVYGEGSTFSFSILQKVVDPAPIGAATAQSLAAFKHSDTKLDRRKKLERVDLSRASVLVVDDVQTNLDVARGLLKPYKLHIDTVMSGEASIRAIREGSPRYDAVFMDHMMPEMDGVEAVRIIRHEIDSDYAREVPIIALTANAIVGNEELFLANGFSDYLSKPIDILELDKVLRRWIPAGEDAVKGNTGQKGAAVSATDAAPAADAADAADAAGAQEETAGGPEGAAAAAETASVPASSPVYGVDLEEGLARFGYDAESYYEVLGSYARNTASALKHIRQVPAGDLSGYAITVHGLKGASRSIGANKLGDMAEALEHAAKAGENVFVVKQTLPFVEEAEKTVASLNKLLAGRAQEQAAEKPCLQTLNPFLVERIRKACKAYDIDEAEAAVRELGQYTYEQKGDLPEQIADCLAVSDFNGVLKLLE
ncbi:MAG: transporter substrate-binding domain-containing protein [Clostridiales Family XIII bacterium]|nr:transporter substrate-binding domain-containing protein [Clostridiales Family XIII bacterium]